MAPGDWTYVLVKGHRFYFKFQPGTPKAILHITYEHGCEMTCAVVPWIKGDAQNNSTWNNRHSRFEFVDNNHSIYWEWIDQAMQYVSIITCVNLADKEDCTDV